MSGFTINLTIGRNGGFYVHRHRVCLWRVAVTWWPYDIDAVIRAGLDAIEHVEMGA